MSSSDSRESPREFSLRAGYVALLCASPILFIFGYLGDWDKGIGAWFCAVLMLMVIRARWDLRRYVWFWITIVFGGALQVPFIQLVPWGNRNLTGISGLPVALLDYGIVYGCVKLVERAVARGD